MDHDPRRGSDSIDPYGPATRKKLPIPRVRNLLAVAGIAVIAACLFLPAVRTAREPARRNSCANNLKQIGMALRNYEAFHHALPPAYTTDAEGKPLHSWRTLILPFMEQQQLYDSIDMTKPWDDPANAEAFKTTVSVYQCPSALESDNLTTYLAIVTPNSCFRATEPRSLSDLADGAAQTLIVIDADSKHAVPWMAPMDADESVVLGIGPKSKPAHSGGTQGLIADGSVRFFQDDLPADQRRALISIAGNDNPPAK